MFINNRPRYWVSWYDRWHLPLVLLLALLLCLLGYQATLPMPRPTLQAAHPGATLSAGLPFELTGTAQADSVVSLWDADKRLDDTRADGSGNFKFIIQNAPAGAHSFRVVAEAYGRFAESAVLYVTAAEPVAAIQPTVTAVPATATAAPPPATALPPTTPPATAAPTATISPPAPTSAPTGGPAVTMQRRGKDNAEMVLIPAGAFVAGSEITRTAYLDAFWIDRTEVTNDQFKQFVDATGYKTEAEKQGWGYEYVILSWERVPGLSWLTPGGAGSSIADRSREPVGLVSWDDAAAYCAWADKRLPTEAEWEKAARGSDGRAFAWGNTWDGAKLNFCEANCSYSWKESGINDGYAESSPVGSFAQGASPFGALDVAGNVWEWVDNWYAPDYATSIAARGSAAPGSGDKVVRGGAWSIHQAYVSTTSRLPVTPLFRERSVGMRCAQ